MILVNGFYQQKELCPADQKYYTAARHFLKDNGMRLFMEYLVACNLTSIMELDIPKLQFITVLELALEDYQYILFNPLTFKQ